MTTSEAAFLGLLQGLTEFLPVSSTAHLLIAQEILGINKPGLHLEVAAHLGTVAAVCVHYRALFRDLTRQAVRGGATRRLAGLVLLATTMLGAYVLVTKAFPDSKHWREDVSMVPVGLGVVGVFMIASRWFPRRNREPGIASSLATGLAQCVAAILPGCSRSGSTIGTGLAFGVGAADAAQFSFLLSVPAVLLGTAKDLADEGLPADVDRTALLVCGAVAFVSGMLAIRVLLRVVGAGRLHWFGPYCLALAAVVHFVR